MSGVFGILDSRMGVGIEPLLRCMGMRMTHRDWYVVDTYHDQGSSVGLGRIAIGILNQETQPACSSDGDIVVFLSGELYNAAEIRKGLLFDDYPTSSNSDFGRLVLQLYQKKGLAFAGELDGAFIVSIWDRRNRRLVLANDRFGLYPLFYACRNGRMTFAPEMKGVLCDPTFPKEIDWTALAQYMRFQHLLGERTFFEGIKLLPGGSLLIYDLADGMCTLRSYWTFGDIPYCPDITFSEAVEEAGALLRRAVRRLSSDSYRPGVYLSGGLDSRTILGMIDRRPVVSLTYGVGCCRDVHLARHIARVVGSGHHWFDLSDGNWIKAYVDLHLALTEGLHSWIHAHGISTLSQARQMVDVILTGWDGGTVMGHRDSTEPLQVAAVDDMALLHRLFHLFCHEYTWPSLTEAETRYLYCEPMRNRVIGLALDSFREELSRFLGYRPDIRGELFYLRNHCGRLTQNMVTFTRSHVEVRFPFFDYSLFCFLFSLPVAIRGHRRLYRAVMQRELPRLAHIPYDHDELLPTTDMLTRGAHEMWVKLKRRLNRHVAPIFPEKLTLYADYERYLREELADWAEDILFDRRTVERGIFNPAFLRSLMARHLSGLEQWTIGKIAPAMTYEMMLRELYD